MAAGRAPSWSRTSRPGRHDESRARRGEGGNVGGSSRGRCDPSVHVEDEVFPAAEVPDASPTSSPGATEVTTRSMTPDDDRGTEIRFFHSDLFPHVLQETACSLLVSTYQAGQLVAVGVHDEQLIFSFRRFDRAMGIALGTDQIAVAGKEQIWSLHGPHRTRRRDRARRTLRPVLAAAHLDRHRRDPVPRDRLGSQRQRRAGPLDRQHPLLLPGRPRSPLQLRPALAATVHLPARRAGPLPPQRPGHARPIPGLRHGDGHHRHWASPRSVETSPLRR